MKHTSSPQLVPNTFAVHTVSENIITLASLSDLTTLCQHLPTHYYILGEGSNSLFVDPKTVTIIKPEFKGIEITPVDSGVNVKVGAGENWHHLVEYLLEKGIYGLENLALIPGSVGAAPVQNIGAYGVEFSDFCTKVYWFDFQDSQAIEITKSQCEFSYRESIFKGKLKSKGVITAVEMYFPNNWQPRLNYNGLNTLTSNSTAKQIMAEVIRIRQGKLPDPSITPNAGSFFKNPVVDIAVFQRLQQSYYAIPHYPQDNGKVKLAAGWLIDMCDLKGVTLNKARVHEKQALVLTNKGNATGLNIAQLAFHIQQVVFDKFGLLLEPEVRIIGEHGETTIAQVLGNE